MKKFRRNQQFLLHEVCIDMIEAIKELRYKSVRQEVRIEPYWLNFEIV